MKMHFNRTVVHPDYVGLGLGIRMIEATSQIMKNSGFDVWGKFSSVPVARAFEKSKNWVLKDIMRFTPTAGKNMARSSGFRQAVKTYSYRFKPTEVPHGVTIKC